MINDNEREKYRKHYDFGLTETTILGIVKLDEEEK